MTGTASSKGKMFMDFDSYKNQEWLRRRKLRLEQVRKQSSEIARALRQKVSDEEKRRLEEYERMRMETLRVWKAEKLEELEGKLRCALEGFGAGYKLAEEEPDPGLIMENRIKTNLSKAQKRGEIAQQEELRRNKLAKEKVTSSIERKKLTRKKEDLRSALVCTVPVRKQFTRALGHYDGAEQTGQHAVSLVKKKMKRASEKHCAPGVERKVRKLQRVCSSGGESGVLCRSSKSTVGNKKSQKEGSEGSVEFYDFSSRYYCKSFREFPHLVERIDHDSRELNANELARVEEEMEREESKKKSEADAVSQGRGMEALRREKVSRDYANLVEKLDELSRKEKILKAQRRNLPSFLHMNDERLSQRTKTKQRAMESRFETLYYQATATPPPTALPPSDPLYNLSGGGDYCQAQDRPTTKLSFSASNLKHNTPATSPAASRSPHPSPRSERADSQRRLLINIEKALAEGRELRRSGRREWREEGGEGGEGGEGEEGEEGASAGGAEEALRKCQGSQTEGFDEGADESLPVSSSTSYRSPPSALRCHRLQEFVDYLEGMSEAEERWPLSTTSEVKRKVKTVLQDLLAEGCSSACEEEEGSFGAGPTLGFYIERLLSMSRECIANLSVSSENVSTPNITDLEVKDDSEAQDSECLGRRSSGGEDLIRKSRLERAEALEKSIRNWRMILENKSAKRPPERAEDEGRATREPVGALRNSKIRSRYDEITKKCSERIVELSDMLEKVRKEKEKLLSSASGGSSADSSKGGGISGEGFDVEEKEVVPVRRSAEIPKTSPALEGFVTRYNLTRPREETVSTTAVADSQSFQDLNESLESLPDVMDELLRREILTSPFKWSDGELSSELTTVNDHRTKPSSIESVIGNFRKEIHKIKPFSLAEPHPRRGSPTRPRWSAPGEYLGELPGPKRGSGRAGSGVDSDGAFQEESSVDSINHCLTSLGLNWAKSFLRKNAESRARDSSSTSEKKSSGDEGDSYA